jgi:hypothetical protein
VVSRAAKLCSLKPSTNVRFGSKADIGVGASHVRYGPTSDIHFVAMNRPKVTGKWNAACCWAHRYVFTLKSVATRDRRAYRLRSPGNVTGLLGKKIQ